MERLTDRKYVEPSFVINGGRYYGAVADKLSAYEDTGLEPEEIKENEKIINDLTRAICTKDEEIKKLKCQLAECKRRLKSEEK